MVREFWSIVRHIATGYAGGGVFNGNANREVISAPFLICPSGLMRGGAEPAPPRLVRGQEVEFSTLLVRCS
jgi:hypothetical protein